MTHQHGGRGGGSVAVCAGLPRFAVVGSPNSGKTTLFNALTGLHAKTGNYPGVTVARFEGQVRLGDHNSVVLEDLPGTYSLDPISPDEQIVVDVLDESTTTCGSTCRTRYWSLSTRPPCGAHWDCWPSCCRPGCRSAWS